MTHETPHPRVLLVDPDPGFVAGIVGALQPAIPRPHTCAWAAQALRLNRLLAFDLVLISEPVRGTGTLGFVQRLRRQRSELRVVLFSEVLPSAEERERLKEHGVVMVLSRARNPALLAQAVRALIDFTPRS